MIPKVAGHGSDKNDLEYAADHDELSEQDHVRNTDHAQTTTRSCINYTYKCVYLPILPMMILMMNMTSPDQSNQFNEALSDLKLAIAEMREVAAMREEAYETESETDDDFG